MIENLRLRNNRSWIFKEIAWKKSWIRKRKFDFI